MINLITEAREQIANLNGVKLALEQHGIASAARVAGETVAVLDKMCDALEKAEAQMPRWIPVTERLPDGQQDALIWFDRCGGDIGIGYRSKDKDAWFMLGGMMLCYNVTHWMPLPAAPEKGE